MRALVVALGLALAACSEPAPPGEPPAPAAPEAPSADATTADLLAAAVPVVSATIGTPVGLAPSTVNIQNDWAWLVVQPQTPTGGEIDWSTTAFAEDAALGVLDGGGTTYILLKRENGAWRVLDHVVGPTDVAWINWHTQYGAPPELMGLPPG
jgi:hypothetical protein